MLNMNRDCAGVTLLELMLVIAIASIILAFAIPSFITIIQNNRSLALSSDFTRAANFARSEAVRRAEDVAMCIANTSLSGCNSSGSWNNGWLIFSDPDGGATYDSSTDDLVAVHQSTSNQEVINSASPVIIFNGNGFLKAGVGTYQIYATGCKGNYARTISILSSGRITITNAACP